MLTIPMQKLGGEQCQLLEASLLQSPALTKESSKASLGLGFLIYIVEISIVVSTAEMCP